MADMQFGHSIMFVLGPIATIDKGVSVADDYRTYARAKAIAVHGVVLTISTIEVSAYKIPDATAYILIALTCTLQFHSESIQPIPIPTNMSKTPMTRLATLVDMPLDILTEIADHLAPIDILSLARTNKSLRTKLTHPSSISAWHTAIKNVQGLPDCPPDMSLPDYISLLFSETCTSCGRDEDTAPDALLRVRLCSSCRTNHLIPVGDIREGHREFLLSSSGMPAGPFRPKLGDYALRNEYEVMRVELDQLESYSEILLWAEEKRQSIAKRRKETVYVDRFLQMMGLARRQEIQRRLMKMGWEANDMNFHTTWSTGRINWQSLVSKIKPITDKDWEILEPKLIPLLEINRKERIQVDNQAKATLFAPMIRRMKDTLPLDFTAQPRHPRKDIPLFPIVVYRAPLPPINRVLEWPVVKSVYGADSATIVDLGANFNQHRQEIEARIVEWQSNTHRAFRDMVQREHEALGFPLDPAVAVGPDRSDLFAGLSDDLKCLLRADVLFTDTSGPRGKNRPLLSYSEISSQADWDSPEYRLDPSQISLDTKALRVAREILKSMHQPFASYLEMGRYGAYYVCGRCHDTSPKTWKMLVQHYSFADKICALFQKNSTAENGITYNHIHHPAFKNWKPMIIPAPQAIHCLEKSKPSQNPHCVCMVCDTFIFKGAVSGPESGIIQHLSDVHNIVGPTKDVHYRRTTVPLSRRFTPEDSDSDDEINH